MALRKEDLRFGGAVMERNSEDEGREVNLSLLEKTRRLNRLLQQNEVPVGFATMAEVLSELIGCNAYLVDRGSKLLGHCLQDGFECRVLLETVIATGVFPVEYNQRLLNISQTVSNFHQEGGRGDGCFLQAGTDCFLQTKLTTIIPINGGGERLGTLVLARFGNPFDEEDLILAEYGAAVVGMELLRAKSHGLQEETRRKAAVQVAVGSLSYSEREAMRSVFEELGGGNGLLVASKIADRMGLTRSVIVNGLRKLGSAGVISARSLGMKGTYIQILNPFLPEALR